MANINIPGYTPLTDVASGDMLEIYDVSASQNKSVTVAYLNAASVDAATNPTILSVAETGNNAVVRFVLTGISAPAGATTTVDTGIDLTDYGTSARGGYALTGTLVADSSSSDVGSYVFHTSFRYTTALSQTYDTLIASNNSIYGSSLITAIAATTDGTNLQLNITNSSATLGMVEGVMVVELVKQAL